jgi:V8-like Glu-specific endopeptidase
MKTYLAYAAAATAATLLFSESSFAQGTQDTRAYTPKASSAKAAAPVGLGKPRLPLANDDQFNAAPAAAPARAEGPGGVSVGSANGKTLLEVSSDGDTPAAFGTSTAPYTTSRVALTNRGSPAANTVPGDPVTGYPYRATGKLWMRFGTSWFVCTGSLIKPGVVITAAHCVHNYGQQSAGFANQVLFYPANISSSTTIAQPYGVFSGATWRVPSPYFNGTDTCTQAGVVCNNDIATVTLAPRSGVLAGNLVGWYGYGWNGYSNVVSTLLGNKTTVQITQLGYPVAFDSGFQMQRTDAVGWFQNNGNANLKNTQIGTAQTGGSSGGPWLANFGTVPAVVAPASRGAATVQAVVGVTSYGSSTSGFNRQGASFFGQNLQYPLAAYGTFGAGNIGKILQDTCGAAPTAC